MENNIKVATKNQVFLFSILELLIEDMKYNLTDIYLVRNSLSFTFDNIMYFIKIEKDKIKYSEDLLKGEVSKQLKCKIYDKNESSYLNIMNEIFSNGNLQADLDISTNLLNIQFSFMKLVSLFDISLIIEDSKLIITNIANDNKLTLEKFQDNVYKIKIIKEINDEDYKTYYETLYEYVPSFKNMSKFYDLDKKQQAVYIISKLFENFD